MKGSTARPAREISTSKANEGVPVARLLGPALLATVCVLVVFGLGCLGGCAHASSTSSADASVDSGSTSPAFPVTVTDDAGRTVTVDSVPERIVSLAPANTEILYALGLADRVVGVTTYCDYPPEVRDKPKIGDFVSPNIEAIAAARPDLVLATGGVQADVISKLEALGAKVVVLDPQSVDDVRKAINTTGELTGALDKATDVDKQLSETIEAVTNAAPEGTEPVTAFIEIGQNPLFTAGPDTLLDDMVRIAHGANVVVEPGYVAYSLEQLVAQNPAVYLATKGSMSDPSDLAQRPGYTDLAAVKNARVYVLDDNLVTRPGPRIGEGLLTIAKALHPEWALPE